MNESTLERLNAFAQEQLGPTHALQENINDMELAEAILPRSDFGSALQEADPTWKQSLQDTTYRAKKILPFFIQKDIGILWNYELIQALGVP